MTDTILPTPGTAEMSLDQLKSKQDDLRRAQEAIAGPVPIIPDSPGTFLTLPRGLHELGEWQRQVEVRELTGVDEEALSKLKDQVDFFDTVLTQGTKRVGAIDLAPLSVGERQGYLQQLLIGERDQIFLAIARATYGDLKKFNMTCRFCQATQELTINLAEDFSPREVEGVDGQAFTFTTSKGEQIEYRPVNGADQQYVIHRKGATLAEQNTAVLSRIITQVNGRMVVDPLNYARGMPMRDRQDLLNDVGDRQPSVELTVTVPCVECREEQMVALTWADLFRP